MGAMNRLIELIHDLPVETIFNSSLPEVLVRSIQFDSRSVKPGDLFVAVKGESVDGHRYIPMAISNGAVAVVGSEEVENLTVPYIRARDSREVMAWLAAAFFDHPARSMCIIGVTGTDGKTTTCNLIYNILKAAGLRAGIISTVNAVIMDEEMDTGFHVTTPEAVDIQRYLRLMADKGITHVVLETTSHGLAQHRVTGCEYDIAVVTNITHEHLDYHGSYQDYLNAKARIFEMLNETVDKVGGNPRLAVLNADDQSFAPLKLKVGERFASYSIRGRGMVNAEEMEYFADHLKFKARSQDFSFDVDCPFPGEFNVSNCLAAISAAWYGLGISVEAIQSGIFQTSGIPGRMQRIDMGQPFTAIIDFAHTPNALRVAIETLRKMTTKRVIAVFGSAGLRDRAKRAMMAEISTKLADLTILTAEDPRTESLDGILEEMASAARREGGVEGVTFFRIPDRGKAIQFAVNQAQEGDLVAAFGKGHEQSMCFGTIEYPWDDRTAMRAALASRLKVPGPAMPELPTSKE